MQRLGTLTGMRWQLPRSLKVQGRRPETRPAFERRGMFLRWGPRCGRFRAVRRGEQRQRRSADGLIAALAAKSTHAAGALNTGLGQSTTNRQRGGKPCRLLGVRAASLQAHKRAIRNEGWLHQANESSSLRRSSRLLKRHTGDHQRRELRTLGHRTVGYRDHLAIGADSST